MRPNARNTGREEVTFVQRLASFGMSNSFFLVLLFRCFFRDSFSLATVVVWLAFYSFRWTLCTLCRCFSFLLAELDNCFGIFFLLFTNLTFASFVTSGFASPLLLFWFHSFAYIGLSFAYVVGFGTIACHVCLSFGYFLLSRVWSLCTLV